MARRPEPVVERGQARSGVQPSGAEDVRTQERLGDRFNRVAAKLTDALGSFTALVASVLIVVVWALTGPIFNFSDTWQLFINTSTTVITFWMVFVIQNSANRDAKAIHLKLDELLRVHEAARNELITLEQAPEEVVTRTAQELAQVAENQSSEGVAQVRVTQTVDGRTEQATAVADAGPDHESAASRGTSRSKPARPPRADRASR